MCMGILTVYLYYLYAWCPRRPKDSVRSSRTGVTDGRELPSEFWKPNQVLWKWDDVLGVLDLHLSKDFLLCLL